MSSSCAAGRAGFHLDPSFPRSLVQLQDPPGTLPDPLSSAEPAPADNAIACAPCHARESGGVLVAQALELRMGLLGSAKYFAAWPLNDTRRDIQKMGQPTVTAIA